MRIVDDIHRIPPCLTSTLEETLIQAKICCQEFSRSLIKISQDQARHLLGWSVLIFN